MQLYIDRGKEKVNPLSYASYEAGNRGTLYKIERWVNAIFKECKRLPPYS